MQSPARWARCSCFAVAVVTLATVVRPAAAQTLFYNGDADFYNGWTTMEFPSGQGFYFHVYDDFTIGSGSWLVTGLMGDFQARTAGDPYSTAVSWSSAYWEIRSGITPGNGGTLLYSGTNATSSSVIASPPWYPANSVHTVVSGFAPFTLGPGTYWMTISPYPVGPSGAMAAVWSTSGANGVNAQLNGNTYQDFPVPGFQFQPQHLIPTNAFSYGVQGQVVGASVAPEPATLSLTVLGLGALGIVVRRRRTA